MRSLLCLAGLLGLTAAGCEKKQDPHDRPGFIDTSDPSKVGATMIPPPKGPGGPTTPGKPGK